MAIGDVFKLAVVNSFNGDMINTFHYEQLTEAGGNPAEALATAFVTEALPAYQTYLSDRIVTTVIEVRQVLNGAASFDVTLNENGDAPTGDLVPQWTGPIISWRTGFAGRSFRGRTYLPPCSEADQDAGEISAVLRTQVISVANALIGFETVGNGNWGLGIFSTVTNGAPRPTPIFTPVTGFVVPTTMGTVQRRKPGRGS